MQSCFPVEQPPVYTGAQGVPPHIQVLVELYDVPVSQFLHPDKVPLDGSTTVRCISHYSWFFVISKTAEVALYSFIQITAAQNWIQY